MTTMFPSTPSAPLRHRVVDEDVAVGADRRRHDKRVPAILRRVGRALRGTVQCPSWPAIPEVQLDREAAIGWLRGDADDDGEVPGNVQARDSISELLGVGVSVRKRNAYVAERLLAERPAVRRKAVVWPRRVNAADREVVSAVIRRRVEGRVDREHGIDGRLEAEQVVRRRGAAGKDERADGEREGEADEQPFHSGLLKSLTVLSFP